MVLENKVVSLLLFWFLQLSTGLVICSLLLLRLSEFAVVVYFFILIFPLLLVCVSSFVRLIVRCLLHLWVFSYPYSLYPFLFQAVGRRLKNRALHITIATNMDKCNVTLLDKHIDAFEHESIFTIASVFVL